MCVDMKTAAVVWYRCRFRLETGVINTIGNASLKDILQLPNVLYSLVKILVYKIYLVKFYIKWQFLFSKVLI